jgi:hypothetical protein
VTGSVNSAASVADFFFRTEENDPGKALHTSKKIKGRPTNIRRFFSPSDLSGSSLSDRGACYLILISKRFGPVDTASRHETTRHHR